MRKCLTVLVLALSSTTLYAQEWFYRHYQDPVSVEFFAPEIALYDPTPPASRQAGHRTTLQLPNGDVATATTLSDGWTYVDLSAPSGSDPVDYALSVVDDYATDESNPDLFATAMFGKLRGQV